jgi:predicted ATPase
MRLLHYLEIENFKGFEDKQRIELDHPAVLIGPNNSGKTSAIQSLALWSQAIKSWFDAKKDSSSKKSKDLTTKKRNGAPLNRLNIVAVPVQKTRFFWNKTKIHTGKDAVPLTITVGIQWKNEVVPLSMKFRHYGDEVVYCEPDDKAIQDTELLEFASSLNVHLLYPMSGLATEEPVLLPARIDVLLGQGETAGVLRNLCLIVANNNIDDWKEIVKLLKRLFMIELDIPNTNARGSIDLVYAEASMKEKLDISMSGRGFQQMLLIFAYLFSHKNSILLVDEPDAHLEILRQKQIYVLLRDIASLNKSQVVIVTHSEVILDEALDHNLTLLLNGKADDIAAKNDIKNSLKHFGTEHYIKARECGYVLYVEGGTDIDMLRALAEKIQHPVTEIWDERINVYYVQDNYPLQTTESELERVEGGFGIKPKEHFGILRGMVPNLKGLAILDNDGKNRQDSEGGGLHVRYWKRYEAENYFITPELLKMYATLEYEDTTKKGLFATKYNEIDEVIEQLVLEQIFNNNQKDFETYRSLSGDAAQLIWNTKTAQVKMSGFAEEFFKRLSVKINDSILLKKGEFHKLISFIDAQVIDTEVEEKLNILYELFQKDNE